MTRGLEWLVPVGVAVCVHAGVAAIPVGTFGEAPAQPVRAQLRLPEPVSEPPPEPPAEEPPEVSEPPAEEPPERRQPIARRPAPPEPAPELIEHVYEPAPAIPASIAPVSPLLDSLPDLPVATAPPPPPPPETTFHLGGYQDGIERALSAVKRYPRLAISLGLEGTVEIVLVVGRDGRLAGSPRLSSSSGHAVLDEEALRMARAAQPYPPLPDGYPEDRAELVVPVVFRLTL